MRTSLDLLALPYSLTQLPLVSADRFAALARERGIGVESIRLEALHRVGLLVPLLRVKRPTREIRALLEQGGRRQEHRAHALARWEPGGRAELLEGREEGLLFDPLSERFQSRQSLKRRAGDRPFEASVYLYSQHQLACLWPVRWLLNTIRWGQHNGSLVAKLQMPPKIRRDWLEQAKTLRESVIAITALEPVYYSNITGTLTTPLDFDVEAFFRWRHELEPRWLLDWLDVDADWIRQRATEILSQAQRLDDLGGWSEVVGAGSPDRWKELRGTPRLVMDMRVAGEILLRYYDRLIGAGLATELPAPPRTAIPYDLRLKRKRPLDATLTDFGLSPHPHLILVVEGLTERIIVPRVMRKLGLPADDDFISVQDAEGVTTNLSPLLAYLAPQPGNQENERYIRPVRPLTRFLIVFDPEGPVVTDADREDRRKKWVDRVMRALPRAIQTPIVKDQIDRLVAIRTWNRRGESFEYAHFTNLQLARAIDRIDTRQRKPELDRLAQLVGDARTANRNLKSLLHGPGKDDLAEELWPIIERRLDLALTRQTETRLPVVQVIDEARIMAQEFGRGNTVIALKTTD